jgi:hypothetical protein
MELHLDIWFIDENTLEKKKEVKVTRQISDDYKYIFDAWLNLGKISEKNWDKKFSPVMDTLMNKFFGVVEEIINTMMGYNPEVDFKEGGPPYVIHDPFVDVDGVMIAGVEIEI